DPESTARFVEVNAAHAILGDEEKRRAFDRGEIDTAGQLVPVTHRPGRDLWRTATIIMAVLMLAAASTLLFQRLTARQQTAARPAGKDATVSRLETSENNADTARIKEPDTGAEFEPHLILQQNDSYAAGDTIPLGLQVAGEAAGLAVEITGL